MVNVAAIDLGITLGKLRLRNPTLLAAGILGLTGASLKRAWDAGAGAVITKSVSPEPSEGYTGPRIVQVPGGLLNALGLPNPGAERMAEEIKVAKRGGATVIGSAFGKDPEDFVSVALELERAGADAIELNVSCPHVETLLTIGEDPKLTGDVARKVKKEIRVPVWVKMPGVTHIPKLIEVAKSAERAGADGLTLINTVPAMAIDIESGRAILGNKFGGLSGPAIKPIALRLIYETYGAVKIPMMGCGGIVTPGDAIEYFYAGASAVQVGTGIMYRRFEIFKEICGGIRSFMKKKGLREIKDMVRLIE